MKRKMIFGMICTAIFILLQIPVAAQQTDRDLSREEMSVQRAHDKVIRSEASVARASEIIAQGDSLLAAGEQMITEAKGEMKT